MSILALHQQERAKEAYNSDEARAKRFAQYKAEACVRIWAQAKEMSEPGNAALIEKVRYQTENDSTLFFMTVFAFAAGLYADDDLGLGRIVRRLLMQHVDVAAQTIAEDRQDKEQPIDLDWRP